ncbi:hypothetical protein, partial [Serratia marcescens]|uniref:hypothetical protein n=1 Tax=Serratia marcescens TaxID=615 RepID=UPI001952D3F8
KLLSSIALAMRSVRTFGHVATVNVYEGASVDQAYRWDLERDAPLGADLTVTRINREFDPLE